VLLIAIFRYYEDGRSVASGLLLAEEKGIQRLVLETDCQAIVKQ
jgi:hypothetical protein